MKRTILAPEDMLESIRAFLRAEGTSLDVATEGEGAVRINRAGQGVQSKPGSLQAGGWIKCATALDMADTLRISRMEMGKLLNHLDIKIKACSLGCFR